MRNETIMKTCLKMKSGLTEMIELITTALPMTYRMHTWICINALSLVQIAILAKRSRASFLGVREGRQLLDVRAACNQLDVAL